MLNELRTALTGIPKAELHVHFEGTVTPQTLLELAQRNGISLTEPVRFGSFPPIPPPIGIATGAPAIRDFNDFIGLYVKIADSIRTAGDVISIGEAYLESARSQNIVLSEIYFTPSTFVTLERNIEDLFLGLVAVQSRAASQGHQLRWIFDIVRNLPTDGFDTIELAEHARSRGVSVAAIGLAGFEAEGPAAKFVNAFKAANARGFACLAHAGETGGAESVRQAIELLSPLRIGHGVRALEDPSLVSLLRERHIPLEVSPWSNIFLNIFSEDNHPLSQMIAEGLTVVLAADDPGIFKRDLIDNYLYAAARGVPPQVLTSMARESVTYATPT